VRASADATAGGPDGGDVHRTPKTRRSLRRVAGYFRPHRTQAFAVLLLMAAGAVLGLVPALVTKELLDHLARPTGQFRHVGLVLAAGVAAAAAGGLVTFAQARLETTISQSIMFQLRQQLHDRLLGQSVDFFTQRRTGDVLSRMSSDVQGVGDVVEDTLSGLVSNVFILPATLTFMIVLDWRLTVMLPVLILPWIVASSRRVARATYGARTRTQQAHGRMTAYLNEVLGISGILLVKAFARQGAERARFRGLNSEVRHATLGEAKIQRVFDLVNAVLLALAPAVFWLYGGYLVLRGHTTLGTLVTFVVVLTGRLAGSVEDLASIHVKLAGSMALFERLFEIIDLPVAVTDAPGARPLGRCRGAITFEKVTFSYGPDEPPALDDVSFHVEPGQLVALVGPTGAGKTTVTYLVARFYDPQRGRVLIDGHDVRELTLESLTERIGIVFQDTFLFNATIRDNLRYALPDASDEEMAIAADAAHLHEFIAALPDRYDTVVGERGHRLSGGEKQRLAIARVILKDPRLLILDEATSHLDTVSEHLVQAALAPLFHRRTALVIAHRLSTILAADLILVLDHGRVVERGTHQELLRLGGLYALLYDQQFRSQAAAVLPSR
jgi:ATP-binding cassette subfamily B protein